MLKPIIATLLSALVLMTACKGQATEQSVKSDKSETREKVAEVGEKVTKFGSSIMIIYQDKKNHYWFGSWNTGIYMYDGETLTNFTTEHGLPNNRIDEIKEDADGNIYFTSCHPKSVIAKFDGESITTLPVVASNDWQLNPTDVWFKHAYGNEKVYRYDGTTLHELQIPKPPNLSNSFEIYSIYKDRMGNMWFGSNPVGVCRYNGESWDWITEEDVTEFRDEGANGVRGIVEDKNGDFWFNTENRYSIYDSTTIKSDEFYTRRQSIGALDGNPESGLDEFLSTTIDDDGNLWFVTYLDGVWKYDGSEITHYPVKVNNENIELFYIYKDNNGVLWLGTHKNGVYKFNGETFERFLI